MEKLMFNKKIGRNWLTWKIYLGRKIKDSSHGSRAYSKIVITWKQSKKSYRIKIINERKNKIKK